MKTLTLDGETWLHDEATDGYQFAYYLCEVCGERYPLLIEYAFDVLVGGTNCPGFCTHGPGCRSQRWLRVSDIVTWPQPKSVTEPLKQQIGRYLEELHPLAPKWEPPPLVDPPPDS